MPSTLVPVFISGCAHATQDRGDRGFDRQQPGRPRWRASKAMPKRASRREICPVHCHDRCENRPVVFQRTFGAAWMT
jgi:hypothetical protein